MKTSLIELLFELTCYVMNPLELLYEYNKEDTAEGSVLRQQLTLCALKLDGHEEAPEPSSCNVFFRETLSVLCGRVGARVHRVMLPKHYSPSLPN